MVRRRAGSRNVVPVASLLVALGAAAPSTGQTEEGPRVWTAVSTQGRIGVDTRWRWTSDSMVRTRDGVGVIDFLAERVVVTRTLTRRSGIGVGYAYGAGFPDRGSLREHAFVQQFTWSGGVRPRISLRSRIEERFVTGRGAMLLRAGQQARVLWPLATRSGLRGVVSDELFVQATSTTPGSWGFDGNRMFVGVARTLTPHSAVEMGYMHVYARRAGGNRTSHVMSVTLLVAM